MPDYDYIIVGAGSAGCALAARLSEDRDVTVLLLEAGGPDSRREIHIPAAFPQLFRSELDWGYQTEPQPRLNHRQLYWPRGKVLGGSSAINAMIYMRGHRSAYDAWAAAGCTGWGFDDLLPLFKRAEDNERGPSDFHGAGGPLRVAEQRSPNVLSWSFVEAAQALGLPLNPDFNGPEQDGFGLYQVTQKDARRHTAADAYLRTALGRLRFYAGSSGIRTFPSTPQRPNLWGVLDLWVTRVLFESGRVIGVDVYGDGGVTPIHANREVVLCAGAINSPQILLLSGIGPADHLRALGIPVVADLPGVGENLQDHPATDLRWRITPRLSLARAESPWSLLQYLLFRRGPLTSNVAEAGGFHRTRDGLPAADVQLHFVPLTLARHVDTKPTEHGFSCAITLVGTHSRGRITLRSANFKAPPAIDPNYLSEPREWAALRAGTRLMRRIAAAHAFAPFQPAETQPGRAAQSDDALDSFIREKLETLYHPVGTCKMGPASDPFAVVDPQLRVRGVAGLRVADASIMPLIPNGNTNAPTIMIAEKAADLIRTGRS